MSDDVMRNQDDALDRRVDDAARRIREAGPSDAEVQAATDRVWQGLLAAQAGNDDSTDGCDDFRDRLAEHRTGTLSELETAMVEQHARECIPCRRALKGPATDTTTTPSAAPATVSRPLFPRQWLVAAGFLLPALLVGALFMLKGGGDAAKLAQVEGQVYVLEDGQPRALKAGEVIESGQRLRSGSGTWAVLELSDGSRVELNERSSVQLTQTGSATDLRLERGDVIVQAAKRKTRDLTVTTDEMTVAVKGTVFTVGHGIAGSRVGVLEGSVAVDHGSTDDHLLEPGQQYATRRGLDRKELREQVGWSHFLDQHVALLEELDAVQAELEAEPLKRHLRHDSRLLPAMPENTVLYAAAPNSLDNVHRLAELVLDRVVDHPAFAELWNDVRDQEDLPDIREMLDELDRLSSALGEEVVFGLVLQESPAGEMRPTPVVVAEIADETAFLSFIRETDEDLAGELDDGLLVRDLASLQAKSVASRQSGKDRPVFASLGNHALFSPEPALAAELAGNLHQGRSSFVGSEFHRTLEAAYDDGTEFLIGIDTRRVVDLSSDDDNEDAIEQLAALGLTGMSHAVFKGTIDGDGSAQLSFAEGRSGLASWIAEPSPMGALDFISEDSIFVGSAVTKDAAALLADITAVAEDDDYGQFLVEFREATGLAFENDLADTLGGEVAIGLSGLGLSIPDIQLIVETVDPTRLETSIATLVDVLNRNLVDEGLETLSFESTDGPNGTTWRMTHPQWPVELHHAFQDGYLVLATAQPTLEEALEAQRYGRSFADSQTFRDLLPEDGDEDFSLLVYQDLLGALGGLMEQLGSVSGIPAEAQDELRERLGGATLVHARADDRSIEFAVSSSGAGPGAQVAALLRQSLVQALEHAAEEGWTESINLQVGPAGVQLDPPDDDRRSRSEPIRSRRTY
ncbi:MAG: FecR domain-containing protein [Acidobacteriota bacterium]